MKALGTLLLVGIGLFGLSRLSKTAAVTVDREIHTVEPVNPWTMPLNGGFIPRERLIQPQPYPLTPIEQVKLPAGTVANPEVITPAKAATYQAPVDAKGNSLPTYVMPITADGQATPIPGNLPPGTVIVPLVDPVGVALYQANKAGMTMDEYLYEQRVAEMKAGGVSDAQARSIIAPPQNTTKVTVPTVSGPSVSVDQTTIEEIREEALESVEQGADGREYITEGPLEGLTPEEAESIGAL